MSAAVGVRRQRFIWSITYAHWLCYGVLVFDAQRSPRQFAEWRGKLVFWAGEDKIIYGPHFRVGRPVASWSLGRRGHGGSRRGPDVERALTMVWAGPYAMRTDQNPDYQYTMNTKGLVLLPVSTVVFALVTVGAVVARPLRPRSSPSVAVTVMTW